VIYSLQAIIWRVMVENKLPSPDQLNHILTQKEIDWEGYTMIWVHPRICKPPLTICMLSDSIAYI